MSVKASSKIKFSVKKNTLSYNSKTGLSTVKAIVSFSWSGTPEEYGNDALRWHMKRTIIIILRKYHQLLLH